MTPAWIPLAILLQAVASPAAQPPTDAAVAAIALPEPQLRSMLVRTIFSTQSMGMAAYTMGISENCTVTRPAFEQAVQAVLPRWRANLVGAYRKNVPQAVLSKAAAGRLIDSGPLLMPYMGAIGETMRTDSEPLLKEAAGAVLMPVLNKAARFDSKKVDGKKRMAELTQAKADGSLFCGLQATSGVN